MPALQTQSVLPSLPVQLIWIPFTIVLLIALVYTVILIYHWRKYNIARSNLGRLTISVYLAGAFGFSVLMFLSAASYAS